MWKKGEVLAIVSACLISCGILVYGAIAELLNGQPIIISIIAVILSAVMMAIALYIFDDYVAQLDDR